MSEENKELERTMSIHNLFQWGTGSPVREKKCSQRTRLSVLLYFFKFSLRRCASQVKYGCSAIICGHLFHLRHLCASAVQSDGVFDEN